MENIERPVEVSRAEMAVRTDKNDQEYIKDQLTTIYDYLDEFAANFNSMNVLDKVYPVGSIYISMNNVNPSEIIGGTWEKLPEDFYLINSSIGGGTQIGSNTKDISHKHKLTTYTSSNDGGNKGDGIAYTSYGYRVLNNLELVQSGGATSLDIRPASISVCMWKRVG